MCMYPPTYLLVDFESLKAKDYNSSEGQIQASAVNLAMKQWDLWGPRAMTNESFLTASQS